MGTTYFATNVSVEAATPEIVNMTTYNAGKAAFTMVPTGSFTSPGKISVDCYGFQDPSNLVGLVGNAIFTTSLGTITKRVVCDSASTDGQVGSLLRLRFALTPTDYGT